MASKAAIEMKWENMAQVLVRIFPDLREPYEELLARWTDPQYSNDDDDDDDVPGNHVVYGDIFTHYLILLLRGPEEKHYLHFQPHLSTLRSTERKRRISEAFDFLEGMCCNEDIRVQEVAVVTVLEYIDGSPCLLALAKPHMGPVLLKELKQLQDGWEELARKYREGTSRGWWHRLSPWRRTR